MSPTACPQPATSWIASVRQVHDAVNPQGLLLRTPSWLRERARARADAFLPMQRASRTTNFLDLLEANAGQGAYLAMSIAPAAVLVAGLLGPSTARQSLIACAIPLAVIGGGAKLGQVFAGTQTSRLGRVGGGLLANGVLGATVAAFSAQPGAHAAGVVPSTPTGFVRCSLDVAGAACLLGLYLLQQTVCIYPTCLAWGVVLGLGLAGAGLGAAWATVLGVVDLLRCGNDFTPAALHSWSLYRGQPGTVPQPPAPPRPAHSAGAEAAREENERLGAQGARGPTRLVRVPGDAPSLATPVPPPAPASPQRPHSPTASRRPHEGRPASAEIEAQENAQETG